MFLVLTFMKEFIYSLRHHPNPAETTGPTPQGCPQPVASLLGLCLPGAGLHRALAPGTHGRVVSPLPLPQSVCPCAHWLQLSEQCPAEIYPNLREYGYI